MPEIVGTEYYDTPGTYPARMTPEGELAITESEKQRNVFAAYAQSGIQATTYAILIDLSDTTNWKHTETGRVDISYMSMQADRAANSVGALYVGVITRVSATNADISYIRSLQFVNNSETFVLRTENFSPSQFKMGVVGGALHYGIVSDYETNVAAVNTATALNSPLGAATVTPAVGDIVMKFLYTSGGAYRGSASVLYHGQANA